MKKKVLIIIIVVIVILLVLGIAGYFILKQNNFNFGFVSFDFSASAKALNSIGEAANKNTFENVKLNPFVNGTG